MRNHPEQARRIWGKVVVQIRRKQKNLLGRFHRASSENGGKHASRFGRMPMSFIVIPMTRARIRTSGLGNPPLPQHWLAAALCAFVSLVAQLFQPRRKLFRTATLHVAVDAQRRTQTLTHHTSLATPTESFSGMSRENPAVATGELFQFPEASNRDARVKPRHDTLRGGQRLRLPTAVTPDARDACAPEPGGDTHGRIITQLLDSGFTRRRRSGRHDCELAPIA